MRKEEILAVMGKVFAEYSKNYDPQTSIYDEKTLHDADITYNYLFQLVNKDIPGGLENVKKEKSV